MRTVAEWRVLLRRDRGRALETAWAECLASARSVVRRLGRYRDHGVWSFDLASTALVALLESPEPEGERAAVRLGPWVHGIVENLASGQAEADRRERRARRKWAARRRRVRAAEDAIGDESWNPDPDLLGSMSASQARLARRLLDGESIAEIAAALDISVSAVHGLAKRGGAAVARSVAGRTGPGGPSTAADLARAILADMEIVDPAVRGIVDGIVRGLTMEAAASQIGLTREAARMRWRRLLARWRRTHPPTHPPTHDSRGSGGVRS